MDTEFQLGDIPDLSGVVDDTRSDPWEDGWYSGRIVEKREFTDNNGNDRVFESTDTPSQNGDSRNVRLQVLLTRQSDKATMRTNTQVNYQQGDLTPETIQAITDQKARVKAKEDQNMGSLFRPFRALTQIGALQRVAGIRQFQRNGNGGFELTPLFDKTAYFRLGPDTREGRTQFKQIVEINDVPPKGVKAKLL